MGTYYVVEIGDVDWEVVATDALLVHERQCHRSREAALAAAMKSAEARARATKSHVDVFIQSPLGAWVALKTRP